MAIKLDPNLVDAYLARGLTHAFFKDFDKAIADFNKAIELDPNNTDAQAALLEVVLMQTANVSLSSWNCESLSEEVISLSRENADSFTPEILKIYEIQETFRSSTRVECSGRARLSSGIDSTVPMVFHIQQDEDGDLFYGYEVDPY